MRHLSQVQSVEYETFTAHLTKKFKICPHLEVPKENRDCLRFFTAELGAKNTHSS